MALSRWVFSVHIAKSITKHFSVPWSYESSSLSSTENYRGQWTGQVRTLLAPVEQWHLKQEAEIMLLCEGPRSLDLAVFRSEKQEWVNQGQAEVLVWQYRALTEWLPLNWTHSYSPDRYTQSRRDDSLTSWAWGHWLICYCLSSPHLRCLWDHT